MNDEISYISKEAALAIAKDRVFKIPHADGGWHKYRFRCIDPDDLRELPAADVREVVHGRWRIEILIGSLCSVCGKHPYPYQADSASDDYWKPSFCPNCGAKMDLEVPE